MFSQLSLNTTQNPRPITNVLPNESKIGQKTLPLEARIEGQPTGPRRRYDFLFIDNFQIPHDISKRIKIENVTLQDILFLGAPTYLYYLGNKYTDTYLSLQQLNCNDQFKNESRSTNYDKISSIQDQAEVSSSNRFHLTAF